MPGSGQGRRSKAWIEGAGCAVGEAIEAAVSHLRRSRQALFAGMSCDIEGVRKVVRLAELAGGAIDHLAGTGHGVELEVLRDAGLFLTTSGEARTRADTVLVVGQGAFGAEPQRLGELLGKAPKFAGTDRARSVIWLGAKPRSRFRSPTTVKVDAVVVPASRIAALLGTLRARLAGRPIGAAPIFAPRLDAIAERLRGARFGVAIWASAELEPLALETLAGLVRDLNQRVRFSCLPIQGDDNSVGVATAMTWLTGFPSHVGFGRGVPDHDPWRFDAARLAQSKEADLVLWISAYRDRWPDWAGDAPVIALTPQGGTRDKSRALIEIEVGTPGVDHDTIDFSAATGGLAYRAAKRPGNAPSVAEVVGMMCKALGETGRASR
jgi:formylmethanofuran dehydrogenase subunit B